MGMRRKKGYDKGGVMVSLNCIKSEVARGHNIAYESFYQQVDPAGTDCVAAVAAAGFLKQSGLSDTVLSKIWDMSDPTGKGFLDKRGFFVALKLIAMSQNGIDLSMMNLTIDVPPPKLAPVSTLSGRSSPATDWTIKPSERKKYEEMFYSMSPVNGKLPGDKVRPVMMNSRLPVDSLGRIWDLSDTDQDGFLSKEEFILAMHLIYKALENTPVPTVLPPELLAILRKKNSISSAVPILPDVLPATIETGSLGRIRRSSTPSADLIGGKSWIVNAVDKAKFDDLFFKLDTDMDGFVTGTDIKDTFLQSGLPQSILAHIWNLCDIKQNGKLNIEQFALAMYFVQLKLQGIEIPKVLFPEHIPPTLRPKPASDLISDGPAVPLAFETDNTGNKELDIIGSEIKELQKERMALENDLAQKDADCKIKNGELKNSQNELEALDTMLKQLEMQKGEARKRLNDLDNQKSSVELELSEVIAKMGDELQQIEMLKKQKEQQKTSLEVQEDELKLKRQELLETKQEEERLETLISSSKSSLNSLTNKLQNTQLHISQLKLKMDQLNEQYQFMSDALGKIEPALVSGDCSSIPDYLLNEISPVKEYDVDKFVPSAKVPNEVNGTAAPTDFQEDPFKNKDPFKEINGFSSDPFTSEDPFTSSDPFRSSSVSGSDDPFAADPFSNSQTKTGGFQESDPFGAFPPTTAKSGNPGFDPFGLANNPNPASPVKEMSGVDPFGADPFGPQAHRSTSPTPALPPKKSKAPPPRPAPPKMSASTGAKPAPTRAAPAPPVPPAPDPFKADIAKSDMFPDVQFSDKKHDPFSNPSENHDNFANFDNFADFESIK